MKKRHNYPKNRKPRDTSYSMTQQLLKHFGEEELYRIWSIRGMYHASDIVSEKIGYYIPARVIRYLSDKFGWKREVTNLNLPVVKGIIYESVPENYYKHLIVPGLVEIKQKSSRVNIT